MIKFLTDLYDKLKIWVRNTYRKIEKKVDVRIFIGIGIALAALLIAVVIINLLPKPVDQQGATQPFYEKGIVICGFRKDMEGFSAYNEEDGTFSGFDNDVAQEMIKRMFPREIASDAIEVDSKSGRVAILQKDADFVFAQYTAKSESKISYSTPYFTDSVGFYVNADGIGSLAEIVGKRIGVVTGSYPASGLSQFFKDNGVACEIETYSSYPDLFDALSRGKIDVAAAGTLMIRHYAPEGGRMLKGTVLPHGYCIAFSSSNSKLKALVDRTIEEMIADGTIQDLIAKWDLGQFYYAS